MAIKLPGDRGKTRKSGIDIVGEVGWGTHFCQFYKDGADLKSILVPYFKAGLEDNEFCMWVTSDPLGAGEAVEAMRKALPGFDRYLEKGQIEILSYKEWYEKGGSFDSKRVLNGWMEKLNSALAAGYDGLRLTGNTFWIEKKDWRDFQEYEREVDSVLGKYNVIALCTYSLDKCAASEVIDVVSCHSFALIKRDGRWERIESSEHRLAEEALRQTTERLKTLIHNMPDIVYFKDTEGRNLIVNRAFEEFCGLKEADIIGRTDGEIFPLDLARRCRRGDEEVLAAKTPLRFEEFTERGGKKIYFETRKAPLFNDEGRIIGIVGVSRDITEYKKAEKLLMKAHDELDVRVQERTEKLTEANEALKTEVSERERVGRALLEKTRILHAFLKNTLTPLAFLDRDFNFIMVSDSYAKEAGRDVNEFQGKNHFALYPHRENEAIFREVVRTKVPYSAVAKPFVYPEHPEWGVTYWDWALVPVLDGSGEVEFLVFSLKNVTGKKLAEDALKESTERFRNLVETTSEWVWEVDKNSAYTYVSPKVKDILGYEPEEVLGKTPFDLMPPEEARRVADIFGPIAAARKPVTFLENTNIHKEGRLVVLETSGAPVFDKDGGFCGYRGIDRDITRRKESESEKERLRSKLLQAQKMETIGRLTGGIAHDFNNLIMAIASFGTLALREAKEAPQLRSHLEQILATTERATNLTRQLLIFSRNQPVEMKPLDINSAIDGMLKMLSRLIGENYTIRKELSEGLQPVKADKGNVEQLVMNLVVNARDSMKNGGTILIRTLSATFEEYKLCRCALETSPPGSYVCIAVEDTGIGMDKETIKHLFEPFFSTKAAGKGIGLGLTVVSNIVLDHKGFIDIESEPGKGSVFKVYIPVTSETLRAEEKRALSEVSTGKGERILLVEDEKILRRSVAMVLSRNGYAVFEATDAREALELFNREQGNFDLVFTDVVLLDSTGVELIEELKRTNPKIKALFTSGYLDVQTQWPSVAENSFAFLQKPYEIPELLRLIREIIG